MPSHLSAIAAVTRFYDEVISVEGADLDLLPPSPRPNHRRAFLVNGALNRHADPVAFLKRLESVLSPDDLVVVVINNRHYRFWSWGRAQNFINRHSLKMLAQLSELEVIGAEPTVFLRSRSLAFLRKKQRALSRPSVSVVIPLKNEAGNLDQIFSQIVRLTDLPNPEFVLVEGGSTDGSWEKLQAVAARYPQLALRILQQPSVGKADAVRAGFSAAKNDLLMILDGDLSVSPEELVKFYANYCAGGADLVIGTRFVFPLAEGSMRPLNFLGNLLFTKLVGFFIGVRLSDLLCGTKVISKRDYERVCRWREHYQFRDPFGDFELIFAAAQLRLRISEVPVRYRARTYGRTNIRRFRDGFQLLKMTLAGVRCT